MTNRIAEFDDSDDALRFAKMKGEDYCVCAGVQRMWAVRPLDRATIFPGSGEEPADYGRPRPYNDPDEDNDDER